MKARVTFDYDAQDDDELSLKVGDIISVLREEEKGWWEGQLADKTGFFPSNFVQLIYEEDPVPVRKQHKRSGVF